MLAPSIVTAQSFFAKQRVAVWEIFDRNNDVKLATSTKTTIRTNIEEAFTNSKHYEYYSYSISEVKAALVQQGITRPTPFDIAKKIREMSVSKGAEVDYVIFSVVKVKMHSNSYDEFVVNLSSELFSTTTYKCEKMADVDMLSNTSAIPNACSELLSELLGERLSVTTNANLQSYQQPSTSTQSADKKVGDIIYHNGVIALVIAVDNSGQHGVLLSAEETVCHSSEADEWLKDLGSEWRLPNRSHLQMIYQNKDHLNAALRHNGFNGVAEGWYWTREWASENWSFVFNMNGGYACSYKEVVESGKFPKDNKLHVRAVSAF